VEIGVGDREKALKIEDLRFEIEDFFLLAAVYVCNRRWWGGANLKS
jgi:hypothetical protein